MTLRGSKVIELRTVFSPICLTVFLFAPLLLLYTVSSETVFALDFESRKTLTWQGFAFFALALTCFALGARFGDITVRGKPLGLPGGNGEPQLAHGQRRSFAVLLETALILSIAAYLVWFAIGVGRAGGIGPLLEIWRTDPHLIKETILTTVPGVTTLTQLAVAAIPLALAFGLYRRGSAMRVLIGVVLLLVIVRTVLFQERLASIELLVPIVFVLASPRRVTVPRVVVYAVVFLLAAMTFFSITELRRTYVYTNDFSPGRSATRFFGYYLTSVNNGMAVIDDQPAVTPFYSTTEFLWLFPGIRDLHVDHVPAVGSISLRYSDAFGVDPPSYWPDFFAAEGLDYEFNVLSTPGYLAADYGWFALLAVFLVGLVSGRLYRRSETSPFHRALYGVWLVGLFEFMRIQYFTNTRVFPAYLLFAAAYLVLSRRVPVPAPRPQPVSPAPGAATARTAPSPRPS